MAGNSMLRYGLFMGTVVLLVPVFVLASGSDAFAWGPGVHMVTGNWLLQNLVALPADVAASIMSHPGQFLYGILSPDIFIGKGSLNKKGHSHNWQTGLLLLRLAETAEQQAYAYGYLSHLAADTVAHNVFVPQSSDIAVGSGRLAHVYLEMQADRVLQWDSKDALAVFRERPSASSAALLKKTMRQTPWTFWMKKFLFRQSIFLGGLQSWRSAMGFLDSVIVGQEGVAFAEQMLVVSTRAMVSVLQDVKNSPVRTLDPIGAAALEGFKGQPVNIMHVMLENLFPKLFDKHWRQSLFYHEAMIAPAYQDPQAPQGCRSPEGNNGVVTDKKNVIMHAGSAGCPPHLQEKQSEIQTEAQTEAPADSLTDHCPLSSHAGKQQTEALDENCHDDAHDTNQTSDEAYEFLADVADEVTQNMRLLRSIDSASPIIEQGFTLPDILKNLPPVCTP